MYRGKYSRQEYYKTPYNLKIGTKIPVIRTVTTYLTTSIKYIMIQKEQERVFKCRNESKKPK